MAQPVKVLYSHDLVPFDLPDGQQRLPVCRVWPQGHDVDLASLSRGRIIQRALLDPRGEAANRALGGEVADPVPGQLLEVAAEHVRGETRLAPLPEPPWVSCVCQVRPDGAHHRVVEGDERLGDLVHGPVLAEGVGSPPDQATVHENVERVSQVA